MEPLGSVLCLDPCYSFILSSCSCLCYFVLINGWPRGGGAEPQDRTHEMKLNASTQGPDNEAQPQLQPSSKFIQAARRVVVAFAERASHAANRRQTND